MATEIPRREPRDRDEYDLRTLDASRRIVRACEELAERFDLPLEALAVAATAHAVLDDPDAIEGAVADFLERIAERTEPQ